VASLESASAAPAHSGTVVEGVDEQALPRRSLHREVSRRVGSSLRTSFDLRILEGALELPLWWLFDVMLRASQHEFQVLARRSLRMAEVVAANVGIPTACG
jgi:protein gp37